MTEPATDLLTRVYSHFLTPDSRRPEHPDWPGAVALNGDDDAPL